MDISDKPDKLKSLEMAKTQRDIDFDYDKVAVLFRACVQGLTRNSQSSDVYMATLTFLAKCSEAGLYYRQKVRY